MNLNESAPLACPTILRSEIPLLERFANESHEICLTILKTLSHSLGLDSIAQQHRADRSSTSAIALLKYPQHESDDNFAGHIAHTDVGSLTLLFCEQDGLQALHPASGQWENVKPRQDHAVVNVGDSLHHLSQRALKSCLHRVLPYTSRIQHARYSVIYFMRPEQSASFIDEKGQEWKSIDWHTRKFEAFRARDPKEVESILDGRV